MKTLRIPDLPSLRTAARDFVRDWTAGRTVFAFYGSMGAGKTTFIRAVCEELGVGDAIGSPTFAILNEYRSATTGRPVYHFDFYRIRSLPEALDIGVEDYFDSGAPCFIEWPENVEALLPADTLRLTVVARADGAREIRLD
ncbi:MAG: tRNA (adenosine(37)-N6)-threonylcarbamoyltransferase complex ATPase subunit type 1 TsaE [Tannerella sp.]|jgi:tRNA threonylcarbamoyladenosine biosynthesis protein TsaE|nr:tRNA (adenosine(37)-N6)-threonylcarbamoyltransferase complex ATPase subunit type 1 TsaE [Tannerella sp.]